MDTENAEKLNSENNETWTHPIHLQPYSDKQMYEAYNCSLENLGLRFTRLGLRRFLSMKPFFVEREPLKMTSYFYDCDVSLNFKNLVHACESAIGKEIKLDHFLKNFDLKSKTSK